MCANLGKSLKEKLVKYDARVFLSLAHFRLHQHLRWICASKEKKKKWTTRGVISDTDERESDCTKHSARLLRYVTLHYIALRYITVSGRRVRADRVATVLRDLEERPPVQRWHVQQDPRTTATTRSKGAYNGTRLSLLRKLCASRCSCYSVTSRARRAVGTCGSREKSHSHHDRRSSG